MTRLAAFPIALLLLAHGHDSGFADWFNSLRQPDAPSVSCCGEADQFYARSYAPSLKPGVAFEAVVIGRDGAPDFPADVPAGKVDWNRVNPTGRGVIFISSGESGGAVLCFVPGTAA